jgi:hypothetical protein
MRYSAEPFLNPMPAAKRAERVAIDTLEICLNKLELPEVPLPIPVEEWIEHPLGFEFGIEDLSPLGDGVLGASYVEDGRIVVDESVTKHDGRFRFTAAHELGHMLLHKKQRQVFTDSKELIHKRDARLERQADRFAAALLMPLHLVMKQLFTTCASRQLDAQASITELMLDTPESERLWRDSFVPSMTAAFGVSRAAAINRFLDIRLREDRASFMPRRIAESLRTRRVHTGDADLAARDRRPARPATQPREGFLF